MKHWAIFTLMLLLLLAGCRQGGVDSARLVELDSLIAVAPDSAAALLAAYPDDSLRNADDRAYHALLLTQAKYKAYIHAYSLDTINLAVAHYADGHDADKRTRSLLYKGCVFEELPRLDSAMYYYKAAEDHATQSGDTYHRGYALMRMASLFQSQYAKQQAIDSFGSALNCFRQVGDSTWQLNTLLSLAGLYQTINLDSAFLYVNKAISLSNALERFRYDDCLSTIASCYLLRKDYHSCILSSVAAIRCSTNKESYFNSCHWASQAYAMTGKRDSSVYFLKLAAQPASKADSVLFLRTKYVIFGDLSSMIESGNLADTLVNTSIVVSLTKVIRQYEYQNRLLASSRSHRLYIWSLALITAVLMLTLMLIYKKKRAKERSMTEDIGNATNKIYSLEQNLRMSEDEIGAQQAEIGQLNIELDEIIEQNRSLESDLNIKNRQIDTQKNQIVVLNGTVYDLNEAIKKYEIIIAELRNFVDNQASQTLQPKHEIDSVNDSFTTDIIKDDPIMLTTQLSELKEQIMAIAREMAESAVIYYHTLLKSGIIGQQATTKLREYMNSSYMSKLKRLLDINFPKLAHRLKDHVNLDEVEIVYLHFAGFSNEVICCYCNLTNRKSISNKKKIIATKILGTGATIEQLAE